MSFFFFVLLNVFRFYIQPLRLTQPKIDEKRTTANQRQTDWDTHQQKDTKIRPTDKTRRCWQTERCVCVCVCLYAPAEPRQSHSTEAKLNGEGRLKAVPGPAASVFNHHSPSHLSLHADQAAVKGAMHPTTPIHKCTDTHLCRGDMGFLTRLKNVRIMTAS